VLLLIGFSFGAAADDDGWKPLFSGKDLDG
jgi:hypothetical protein